MIEKMEVYTTEQIEKMSVEELRKKFIQLQNIAKDGNEVIRGLDKMKERYKLALYLVIRNSVVLKKGIDLKKSQKEINKMGYETMCEVLTMIDYEKVKQMYEEGKNK
ncbi:MAG: hypothetical protein IJX99_10790 [Clostridia bacterium]|nr:hypothetical protein [Clostridia bacterium]MBQ9314942.1 hypothetical protein [Clostridia bacterium]